MLGLLRSSLLDKLSPVMFCFACGDWICFCWMATFWITDLRVVRHSFPSGTTHRQVQIQRNLYEPINWTIYIYYFLISTFCAKRVVPREPSAIRMSSDDQFSSRDSSAMTFRTHADCHSHRCSRRAKKQGPIHDVLKVWSNATTIETGPNDES
jgi:hypothetical protein